MENLAEQHNAVIVEIKFGFINRVFVLTTWRVLVVIRFLFVNQVYRIYCFIFLEKFISNSDVYDVNTLLSNIRYIQIIRLSYVLLCFNSSNFMYYAKCIFSSEFFYFLNKLFETNLILNSINKVVYSFYF